MDVHLYNAREWAEYVQESLLSQPVARTKQQDKSFSGADFVTWLRQVKRCKSVAEALALGELLRRRNVLHHVSDECTFQNSPKLLYRMRCHESVPKEPKPTVSSLMMSSRYVALDRTRRKLYIFTSELDAEPRYTIDLSAGPFHVGVLAGDVDHHAKYLYHKERKLMRSRIGIASEVDHRSASILSPPRTSVAARGGRPGDADPAAKLPITTAYSTSPTVLLRRWKPPSASKSSTMLRRAQSLTPDRTPMRIRQRSPPPSPAHAAPAPAIATDPMPSTMMFRGWTGRSKAQDRAQAEARKRAMSGGRQDGGAGQVRGGDQVSRSSTPNPEDDPEEGKASKVDAPHSDNSLSDTDTSDDEASSPRGSRGRHSRDMSFNSLSARSRAGSARAGGIHSSQLVVDPTGRIASRQGRKEGGWCYSIDIRQQGGKHVILFARTAKAQRIWLSALRRTMEGNKPSRALSHKQLELQSRIPQPFPTPGQRSFDVRMALDLSPDHPILQALNRQAIINSQARHSPLSRGAGSGQAHSRVPPSTGKWLSATLTSPREWGAAASPVSQPPLQSGSAEPSPQPVPRATMRLVRWDRDPSSPASEAKFGTASASPVLNSRPPPGGMGPPLPPSAATTPSAAGANVDQGRKADQATPPPPKYSPLTVRDWLYAAAVEYEKQAGSQTRGDGMVTKALCPSAEELVDMYGSILEDAALHFYRAGALPPYLRLLDASNGAAGGGVVRGGKVPDERDDQGGTQSSLPASSSTAVRGAGGDVSAGEGHQRRLSGSTGSSRSRATAASASSMSAMAWRGAAAHAPYGGGREGLSDVTRFLQQLGPKHLALLGVMLEPHRDALKAGLRSIAPPTIPEEPEVEPEAEPDVEPHSKQALQADEDVEQGGMGEVFDGSGDSAPHPPEALSVPSNHGDTLEGDSAKDSIRTRPSLKIDLNGSLVLGAGGAMDDTIRTPDTPHTVAADAEAWISTVSKQRRPMPSLTLTSSVHKHRPVLSSPLSTPRHQAVDSPSAGDVARRLLLSPADTGAATPHVEPDALALPAVDLPSPPRQPSYSATEDPSRARAQTSGSSAASFARGDALARHRGLTGGSADISIDGAASVAHSTSSRASAGLLDWRSRFDVTRAQWKLKLANDVARGLTRIGVSQSRSTRSGQRRGQSGVGKHSTAAPSMRRNVSSALYKPEQLPEAVAFRLSVTTKPIEGGHAHTGSQPGPPTSNAASSSMPNVRMVVDVLGAGYVAGAIDGVLCEAWAACLLGDYSIVPNTLHTLDAATSTDATSSGCLPPPHVHSTAQSRQVVLRRLVRSYLSQLLRGGSHPLSKITQRLVAMVQNLYAPAGAALLASQAASDAEASASGPHDSGATAKRSGEKGGGARGMHADKVLAAAKADVQGTLRKLTVLGCDVAQNMMRHVQCWGHETTPCWFVHPDATEVPSAESVVSDIDGRPSTPGLSQPTSTSTRLDHPQRPDVSGYDGSRDKADDGDAKAGAGPVIATRIEATQPEASASDTQPSSQPIFRRWLTTAGELSARGPSLSDAGSAHSAPHTDSHRRGDSVDMLRSPHRLHRTASTASPSRPLSLALRMAAVDPFQDAEAVGVARKPRQDGAWVAKQQNTAPGGFGRTLSPHRPHFPFAQPSSPRTGRVNSTGGGRRSFAWSSFASSRPSAVSAGVERELEGLSVEGSEDGDMGENMALLRQLKVCAAQAELPDEVVEGIVRSVLRSVILQYVGRTLLLLYQATSPGAHKSFQTHASQLRACTSYMLRLDQALWMDLRCGPEGWSEALATESGYHQALQVFREIERPHLHGGGDMYDTVVDTVSHLCAAVNKHSGRGGAGEGGAGSKLVNADNLQGMLLYVVTHADAGSLPAVVTMMGDFLDDTEAMERMGFLVMTLQVVVSYVTALPQHELKSLLVRERWPDGADAAVSGTPHG